MARKNHRALPLSGGTWNQFGGEEPEELKDEVPRVPIPPKQLGLVAVVDGDVMHVCAGLNGGIIESLEDSLRCLERQPSDESDEKYEV